MSLTNIIIPVIMQHVIMISKQHMGTMVIIKYCKRLDSQNSLAHVVKCDAYMHMHLFLYACVSVSLLSLHLNLTPLPFQLFPYQLSISHFLKSLYHSLPNQIFIPDFTLLTFYLSIICFFFPSSMDPPPSHYMYVLILLYCQLINRMQTFIDNASIVVM